VISAVDTNIFLDVLIPRAPHAESSESLLTESLGMGLVVLSEVTYAELASYFGTAVELDDFVQYVGARLQPSSTLALQRAGAAWRSYALRRTLRLECPNCGNRQSVECARCGAVITSHRHMMADFLIGAHAATAADRLLTRDRGFYRTHFPGLDVVD
jgi:predicted nucleic acid-binding protein